MFFRENVCNPYTMAKLFLLEICVNNACDLVISLVIVLHNYYVIVQTITRETKFFLTCTVCMYACIIDGFTACT